MDSESFSGYVDDVMMKGFLSLSIAIGYDTGLIKSMCESEHSETVEEIESKNNLKGRYVKEWLGAMVVGKMIEVDSESRLYYIPEKYRTRLTRKDMPLFSMMASVASYRNEVKSCFKKDGPSGFVYGNCSGFRESLNEFRESLADDLVDKDLIPSLKQAIGKLEDGATFLEIGCGTGNTLARLGRRFPNSTFTGLDYAEDMLKQAQQLVDEMDAHNVTPLNSNAENMLDAWTEKFDFVYVFDVIHDTSNPLRILRSIHRVLKNDGIFSMVETDCHSDHFKNRDDPILGIYYTISIYHCLPSSLNSPPFAGLALFVGRVVFELSGKRMETTMATEEFQSHLGNVMQSGFLALSIAVGKDLGLLDVMCDMNSPATASEIANKLKLKQRYVKEWLGAMVGGNIVEVDRESRLYHIPQQYRSVLKSGDMVWFDVIKIYCSLRQRLKSCFKSDGPPGYDFRSFPEYYDVYHDFREPMVDDLLDKEVIPQLGETRRLLEKGATFVEIGCGTGNMIAGMAQRFPTSTFVGVDYGQAAIDKSRELASKKNIKNVAYHMVDATDLPENWTKRYDVVFVYDVIHDSPNPERILKEIHRVLKDDGVLSMCDVESKSSHYENRNNMKAAMFYTISTHSCLPSGLSAPPAAGLGACWGVLEIRKALAKAGFEICREAPFVLQNTRNYVCHKIA
ncbi:hypothetical protein ScPMuIL_006009 [Solemya velum]